MQAQRLLRQRRVNALVELKQHRWRLSLDGKSRTINRIATLSELRHLLLLCGRHRKGRSRVLVHDV